MLKRGIDIALAGLLLIVALPILVVVAIAIRIDTGEPVLFCQPRMGRRFHRFSLFKLRTMRVNCAGSPFTLGEDRRITRVGRWLRRSKVDELPQLWNVLRGEMSLVGPRPVIPELALEFRTEYEVLLLVRPGLTDPATVKYCHEEELLGLYADPLGQFKTIVTPDKLRISAAYLERATIWSDLGLMLRTAWVLLPVHWYHAAARPAADLGAIDDGMPGASLQRVEAEAPIDEF